MSAKAKSRGSRLSRATGAGVRRRPPAQAGIAALGILVVIAIAAPALVALHSYSGAPALPATLGGASHDAPQTNCVNPCTISINDAKINDGRPVVIAQGTTVVWENHDPIPYTSDQLAAVWENSGILMPLQSSSPEVFNSPGTFTYGFDVPPTEGVIVVVAGK